MKNALEINYRYKTTNNSRECYEIGTVSSGKAFDGTITRCERDYCHAPCISKNQQSPDTSFTQNGSSSLNHDFDHKECSKIMHG